LKKTISIILSAAIILCSLVFANSLTFANEAYRLSLQAAYNQTEARSMLALLNDMRTNPNSAWYWNEDNETITECEQLNELVYDYALEQIAMQRAAELAVYFSHTRPDGRSAWTAYSDSGYLLSAVTCGENIAAGYATPQEAHEAWKEDFADYEHQNHRRNILNSKFKAVGIGHIYYGGYHFWVQEFSQKITDTDYQKPLDASKNCEIMLAADFITDTHLKSETSSVNISVGSAVPLPEVTAEIHVQSPWLQLIDCEQISTAYKDEFTINNEEIARIENGSIKGIKEGHTEITAVMNGAEISVPIHVTDTSHAHNPIWESNGKNLIKHCTICGKALSKLPFEDLNNYAYYGDYIEYTSVFNKFISGTNPPYYTEFSPTKPITRAMLIAILYRMAGNPYDANNPHTENPFTDIQPSVYYYNAACWALDEGITNQTTFKPNDNVTREQTARFLFAYAEANDLLGDEAYKDVDLSDYPDYGSVHSWAEEPLQWANHNNMITGTQQGYINPQGATQRIHATRILYGFGKVCSIGNFA